MNFSKVLKDLRKENNFSAKDIAQKVSCSTNLIYDWEHGRCEPSYSTLITLADLFGVSVDYLIGREDDFGNVVVPGQSTDQLTAKEKRLLKAFGSLPDIEKNKLIEDAEFYALRHVKQEQH